MRAWFSAATALLLGSATACAAQTAGARARTASTAPAAAATAATPRKLADEQSDPRLPHAHADPTARETFDDPEFGAVTIYAAQSVARGLLLFSSGDGGWNLGVRDMAHAAASTGLWVAGFDTPKWLKHLDQSNAQCSDAAGLLRTLGARVLARERLPRDTPLILGGYSSGATVVYAALAQAQPGLFAGGLSLGFCPDLIIHKPFCPGANHLTDHRDPKPPHTPNFDRVDRLGAPWRVLQGEIDKVCAPHFTPDFIAPLHDARAWMLPLVGHGFGKPKHWMPQYLDALRSLPAPAAHK